MPRATRGRSPGWRDPRLWIGLAIVAASVVAGARVLDAADDTMGVWAITTAHGAGDRIGAEDLSAVRVRFADESTQAGYWSVDETLPADLVLTRGVDAGELLPRRAVGASADTGLVEVPVAVDPELVPGSVDAGSVIDVYLVAPAAADGSGAGDDSTPGEPALAGVTVLDAPALADGFATSGRRQLVLAVPEADAPGFFALLGAVSDPAVTVVRRS